MTEPSGDMDSRGRKELGIGYPSFPNSGGTAIRNQPPPRELESISCDVQ
jgi:hypothetical protein